MKQNYLLIILASLLFVFGCFEQKNNDNYYNETYDTKSRAAWQKPEVVISKLGDLSDKVVADIGAGTGFFSFRFVMQSKKTIAIDIDNDMLELMNLFIHNLPEDIQGKFETRLAKPNNPNLLDKEVDVIVVINTFSYISDRLAYLKTIKKGLKKGGKIMVLNFKKENISPDSPPEDMRIALNVMNKELIDAGFKVNEVDQKSLKHQYIIIASI